MSRDTVYVPGTGFAAGFVLGGALGACAYVFWAAGRQYEQMARLAGKLAARWPGEETEIAGMIKDAALRGGSRAEAEADFLGAYGFGPADVAAGFGPGTILLALAGIVACLALLCFLRGREQSGRIARIRELAAYLERANRREGAEILAEREDEFSPLQDEIYKTVTELRLAAERSAADRRDFADRLADIAHQIKTPVTSIAITAQALEEEPERSAEGAGHGAALIRRQAGRLGQLVEALLTFSRIDSGALRLERKPVDVYTVLEIAADSVEPLLRENQIRLELPDCGKITFSGDMEWTVEVFVNLLKNCADHTPAGGVITVDYGENPLYAEIRVRDSGTGFAPGELPHIFRRFYQGERSRTAGKGIGLGLALAKSIVELEGGFIEAANLPEGGACFTVRFYCHRDVTFL